MLPQLTDLYQTFGPVTEALLRICVGLALVPHGLRMTFGCFPKTGQPLQSIKMLGDYLDKQGFRPGKVWAPAISVTQLVCGPLVALGLFTRVAVLPVVGKYFWNQLGLEYTLMWTIAALYFLAHGGGPYSLDSLIIGREF